MIGWRLCVGLAGFALFGALVFAVFYLQGAATRAERKAHDLQEASERADRMQKALDKVSGAYEALKAENDSARDTRTNTIREIYHNVQVDPGCAPPPAVVSVLDNAIADANAGIVGKPSK